MLISIIFQPLKMKKQQLGLFLHVYCVIYFKFNHFKLSTCEIHFNRKVKKLFGVILIIFHFVFQNLLNIKMTKTKFKEPY